MLGQIRILVYRKGESSPFIAWLTALKDRDGAAIVRARLARLRLGNFGDARSVGGGVMELKINHGPGYRVYFGRRESTIVVLLCAGDKSSQARDIATAKEYWRICGDDAKSADEY